jgi:hypothetical protein
VPGGASLAVPMSALTLIIAVALAMTSSLQKGDEGLAACFMNFSFRGCIAALLQQRAACDGMAPGCVAT